MVVMVVLSLLVAITVVPGKTAELTSQRSQSARLDAGGIQAKEALTRYFILHNVLYAV
jgi:hypothetical protein